MSVDLDSILAQAVAELVMDERADPSLSPGERLEAIGTVEEISGSMASVSLGCEMIFGHSRAALSMAVLKGLELGVKAERVRARRESQGGGLQ